MPVIAPPRPSRPLRARLTRLGVPALALAAAAAGALLFGAAPAGANPAGPHDPIGHLDVVSSPAAGQLVVRGWAVDPDYLTNAVRVLGLLDGRPVSSTVTKLARPDVARRIGTGPAAGFALAVAVPATERHTVCVAVANLGAGNATLLGCIPTPLGSRLSAAQLAAHSPAGRVESGVATAGSLRVSGWTADPDYWARSVTVVVYVDGTSQATVLTSVSRPELVTRVGTGPRPGFSVTVPVSTGAHEACVWAVSVGLGGNRLLGCRTVDTRGPAGSGAVAVPAVNRAVVTEANRHLGQPYVWGATGPRAFDCSGLVLYSYRVAGRATPRIAADQFRAARVIPANRAVPGDLVFYHDSVGYVYHVGIYTGPGMTTAAVDPASGVRRQAITDPTATYGSFTHT